jgi:hypothetical protein
MGTPDNWRKSSYSGPGDGDSCVEISNRRNHVAVRDSKIPTGTVLVFPVGAYSPFIKALRNSGIPVHHTKS